MYILQGWHQMYQWFTILNLMLDQPDNSVSAEGLRAALVVSHYHNDITTQLETESLLYFIHSGGLERDCRSFYTAGSWELPVIAKQIIETKKVDLIVVLGCIITGETNHDKVIGYSIAQGLMDLSISWGNPVAMGVLTCQTMTQALERTNSTHSNKGQEAMHAAIQAAQTIRSIQS